MTETVDGLVSHINPDGMLRSPAFTQVVRVSGPVNTIYVGGQNGVDSTGALVGEGDLRAQTTQVFANLQTALAAAGAGLEHVIKFNLFVENGQPIQEGFEVYQKVWGTRPNPPLITMAFVAGLGVPGALVELEAVAVVP